MTQQIKGPGFVPRGWPPEVLPPQVADWQASAINYLLDCCPPDFRAYPVLRRHPIVLAQFAAAVLEGQLRAGQHSLANARVSLRDHVAPHVVEEAVQTWHRELTRLRARRGAVGLIEEALRGHVFVPKL